MLKTKKNNKYIFMEGKIKISPENLLNYSNFNIEEWNNSLNLNELNVTFENNKPFPFVLIDNFLKEEYAEKLYNDYPIINQETLNDWHIYNNPIEVKYAYDNFEKMPNSYQDFFHYINTDSFIDKLKVITGIPNLEYDPYLHGAGIHAMPNKGRLHMHLDYEKHPFSGKERRVNLIYFLNKNWKEEYGGNLELWHSDNQNNIDSKVQSILPVFNRAVIFKTNDISWHGIPDVINCPEEMCRKSIACYWVSDFSKDKTDVRLKAKFVKRPDEDNSLMPLYNIRKDRRILKKDLEENNYFCPI